MSSTNDSKWIDVKDKMPKLKKYSDTQSESDYVDIKLSDGSKHEAWYNTVSGWENMEREFSNVTHWKNNQNKNNNG